MLSVLNSETSPRARRTSEAHMRPQLLLLNHQNTCRCTANPSNILGSRGLLFRIANVKTGASRLPPFVFGEGSSSQGLSLSGQLNHTLQKSIPSAAHSRGMS